MNLIENSLIQIEQCLKELADLKFQERVWVRGEGPEVSSYTEVVCQLFDDTALRDLLEAKKEKPLLSDELDSILLDLSKVVDSIDYRMDVNDILNHPEWPNVRRLASEALRMIDRQFK